MRFVIEYTMPANDALYTGVARENRRFVSFTDDADLDWRIDDDLRLEPVGRKRSWWHRVLGRGAPR